MNPNSNQESQPFTIVVGIDYSELSEEVLRQAILSARMHERAQLHVVHVLAAPVATSVTQVGAVVVPDVSGESERLKRYVEEVLMRQSATWGSAGRPPVEQLTTHVGVYGAPEVIAALAGEVDAELVVVGTHGHTGVKHFFLGSIAEATVRRAPCPVLVVRPKAAKGPEVEAPCSRCVEVRQESDGAQFWCSQHRESHGRRHTYRVGTERPSHQSGLLLPV